MSIGLIGLFSRIGYPKEIYTDQQSGLSLLIKEGDILWQQGDYITIGKVIIKTVPSGGKGHQGNGKAESIVKKVKHAIGSLDTRKAGFDVTTLTNWLLCAEKLINSRPIGLRVGNQSATGKFGGTMYKYITPRCLAGQKDIRQAERVSRCQDHNRT